MFVTKSDGSKEEFSKEKIAKTCLRAHVNEKTAKEIANYIEKNIGDGTSTHVIYKMILDELDKRKISPLLFTIRDAIADLDPESFELFAKKVLERHDYSVKWNVIISGKCVEHQIDLVAEKKDMFLIECKRHFNPHRFCGLEVALQVQARLEDIKDGFSEKKNKYDIKSAWIFTNSKFSEHAKLYANKKGIRLTGWRSGEFGIERLVESKKIYPITILSTGAAEKRKLLDNEIITIQDILLNEKKIIKWGFEGILQQVKKLI